MALAAWLAIRVLVQSWRLQPLSLPRRRRRALAGGVVGRLAASALAIVVAPATHVAHELADLILDAIL